MLKPLDIDQIEALGMDSLAVLQAPLDRFRDRAHWSFSAGGDDLDDFDAAVFEAPGLGAFGVLRYRGQPEETVSVFTPSALPPRTQRGLLRLVLREGGLSPSNVLWTRTPMRPRQIGHWARAAAGAWLGARAVRGLRLALRRKTAG
jgi:hypothetical protein